MQNKQKINYICHLAWVIPQVTMLQVSVQQENNSNELGRDETEKKSPSPKNTHNNLQDFVKDFQPPVV